MNFGESIMSIGIVFMKVGASIEKGGVQIVKAGNAIIKGGEQIMRVHKAFSDVHNSFSSGSESNGSAPILRGRLHYSEGSRCKVKGEVRNDLSSYQNGQYAPHKTQRQSFKVPTGSKGFYFVLQEL